MLFLGGVRSLSVYGNWSESCIDQEVIEFFKFANPQYLSYAHEILYSDNKNKCYMDRNEVLAKLYNGNALDETLFGLLNLSLSLRYFQPKSSLLKPNLFDPTGTITSKKIPTLLRGWSTKKPQHFTDPQMHDFQWKMMSAMYHEMSNGRSRISFLSSALNNFYQYFSSIYSYPKDDAVEAELKNLDVPLDREISLINYRSFTNTPIGVLDAFLHEYQNAVIFNALGITNSYSLLIGSPAIDVWNVVPPLYGYPQYHHHDILETRRKWGQHLKVNSTDPFDFLRTQTPMVFIQVFINLSTPESPAILEQISEDILHSEPWTYEIFVLADMNNETEKHIALAYRDISFTLGARTAADFLLDGFKNGFKAAYKHVRAVTKWDALPTMSSVIQWVNQTQEYAKANGINKFSISVDGEFIQKEPVFAELKATIYRHAKAYREYARRQIVTNQTDFRQFVDSRMPRAFSAYSAFNVGPSSLISIYDLTMNEIFTVLNDLCKDDHISGKTPTWYIDCEPPQEMMNDPDVHRISSKDLSPVTNRILRSGNGPRTIVGCHSFPGALTNEELNYVLIYLAARNGDGLYSMEEKKLTYVLLWRGSMEANGIYRGPIEPVSSPALLLAGQPEKLFEWYHKGPIMTDEFRAMSEMMNHIVDSGIGKIAIIPAVPLYQMNYVPEFLHYSYQTIIHYDSVDDAEDQEIIVSNNWQKAKYGQNIYVTGIVSHSYVTGCSIVQVGDQRRSPLSDGYFINMLPIGIYQTKGVIEKQVIYDSLLPICRFFTGNGEQVDVPTDNTINLLTFVSSPAFESRTAYLLRSISENSTIPIRLYLVDGFRQGVPQGIETVVIPRFYPHFLTAPSDIITYLRLFKFTVADLFVPPEHKRLVYADQSIAFHKDILKIQNLDMKSAAVAAPLMSSQSGIKNGAYWNMHSFVAQRYNRPFHNSILTIFDMDKWRTGAELFRNRLRSCNVPQYQSFDDEVFNSLQMEVQVMTLPENVAFCSRNSDLVYAKNAFAINVCDEVSKNFAAKHYDSTVEQTLRDLKFNHNEEQFKAA